MKKTMVVLAVLMAAFLLVSCMSPSADIEGTGVTLGANKPVIIDYKGQSFGGDIPGWTIDAANGDRNLVQKALHLEGKKIWLLQNDGTDIDILKEWTDQIQGRSQIASSIEQSVVDVIQNELDGSVVTEAQKKMMVDRYSGRLVNLTLNGLEKEADYWTLTQTLKTGLKKGKSADDYIYKYTYLAVFAMDEELFTRQLEAAMANVDDNDSESENLRRIITEKVKEKMELATAVMD